MPLYLRSAASQGTYSNSLSFRCFHLGLVVESIREVRGVSHGIKALVELDSPIGEFQWHQKGVPIQQTIIILPITIGLLVYGNGVPIQ
jgi:hypothetical protein